MVRSLLRRQGFRFRLNVRELPGKPDIVLPRYHAVIFVNGCFWHGHDCARFKWPKTRTDYWRHKIEGNRANDQKVTPALLATGWRVGIVTSNFFADNRLFSFDANQLPPIGRIAG